MPDAKSSSPKASGLRLEIALAALIAIAVLFTFWSQQRYPALLKKLHTGTAVKVAGPISFDALLKVTPSMAPADRVLRTAVNWLYTNRFGMYFALPFGAALMTLLGGLARPRRFESAPANILCGFAAGTPLGVCTNCATPVAQGLLDSGASSRLTLAAMISSPSFNPVVVAMAFVLFPLPLALSRIVVPLLLLALLPWLVPETTTPFAPLVLRVAQPSVMRRLTAFFAVYFKNLLRLTLMTLPWMLLAALLGALAAELIPAYGTRVPVSILGIIAVALLGTLLPVPMALDVALAYVLYRSGVPVPYVAALLCTLGPVSVYSLSALSRQLGRTVSLRLAAVTAVLGALAGLFQMAR